MIDKNRLQKASTLVLLSYLGVAAEFVAEDAIEKLQSGKADTDLSDDTRLRIYFIGLGGLLDKLLPFEQIRGNILETYNGSR